ncbi:MAG: hypothetical protein WC023_01420 [Rhodocyclaceae bacterium]
MSDDWLKNGLPVYHGGKDRQGARSEIDKLGGPSGFKTSQYTNADGSVTTVQLKGDMPPQISTTGTKSETPYVEMDSGGIDLVAVAPLAAERFDDGRLRYGTETRAYAAAKRLQGKLNTRTLASSPCVEGGPPVSFRVLADSFGVRNETLVDLLYLKKLCASYAPASMFCGKARLYAQAQYGAPLKYWQWAPSVGTGSPPELRSGAVGITTHSGVYLDADKTHWLLSMDNLGVKITRLKRRAEVQPLVNKLAGSLSVDEAEKVEAYILSRSYPDPTMSFWVAIPDTPVCDMLGYGWKFNWNGTAADIIEITPHEISLGVTNYTSKHYRVSFSRAPLAVSLDPTLAEWEREKLRWSATLSVVESSAPWRNYKYSEVIASPLWGAYELGIFGSVLGGAYGDAPVYCFYQRNELQVFRFTASGGEAVVKYSRTGDVGWMGNHDWSVENPPVTNLHGTVGLQGAGGEWRQRTNEPFTGGFTGPGAAALVTLQSYSFLEQSCDNKTLSNVTYYDDGISSTNAVYRGDATISASLTRNLSDGVPFYEGGASGPTLTATSYGNLRASTGAGAGSDITVAQSETTGTVSESDNSLLIIPFGDAEAVYLHAVKTTTRDADTKTGSGTSNGGSFFVIYYEWEYLGVHDNWVTTFGADGTHLPAVSWGAPVNTRVTTATTLAAQLVTSTGSYDFTPEGSLSPFYAPGAETVSQSYWTNTSLRGACFGQGASNPAGFATSNPFIGWA